MEAPETRSNDVVSAALTKRSPRTMPRTMPSACPSFGATARAWSDPAFFGDVVSPPHAAMANNTLVTATVILIVLRFAQDDKGLTKHQSRRVTGSRAAVGVEAPALRLR